MNSFVKVFQTNIKSLLKKSQPSSLDRILPQDANIIASVRSKHLTYCGYPKLENLAIAAREVLNLGVKGSFVEAGVALGGSAIVLSNIKGERELHLYDVFGMIPPPNTNDEQDAHDRYQEIFSGNSLGLGGNIYYGYQKNLYEVVKNNLSDFGYDNLNSGIFLHKGLFIDEFFPKDPVALAHIDCDWYDSVRICVERLMPVLSSGGMIVFDDYSSYSGCRKMVDEVLRENSGFEIFSSNRSIVLQRS